MTMPSAFRALLAVGVLLGLTACGSLGSVPAALPSGGFSGTLTAPASAPSASTQASRPLHAPRQPQAPRTTRAARVTQAPPSTRAPTPTHSASAGCYPKTNAGNCYEPGEFCRTTDHGVSGVAGDGERIRCEDNDGWRWEPI